VRALSEKTLSDTAGEAVREMSIAGGRERAEGEGGRKEEVSLGELAVGGQVAVERRCFPLSAFERRVFFSFTFGAG